MSDIGQDYVIFLGRGIDILGQMSKKAKDYPKRSRDYTCSSDVD